MSSDIEIDPPQPSAGIGRRAALRTGVHAAWAVPVISLVSAAPAAAASGEPFIETSNFSATVTGAGPSLPRTLSVSADLTNRNTADTTTLVVLVTIKAAVRSGLPSRTTAVSTTPDFEITSMGGTGTNSQPLVVTMTKRAPQVTGSGGSAPSASVGVAVSGTADGTGNFRGTVSVVPVPSPGTGDGGAATTYESQSPV